MIFPLVIRAPTVRNNKTRRRHHRHGFNDATRADNGVNITNPLIPFGVGVVADQACKPSNDR